MLLGLMGNKHEHINESSTYECNISTIMCFYELRMGLRELTMV
jgi:hypothetical protein